MAFSMFLRGASSKLNGCPSRICQNAIRLNTSPLQSISTLRMIRPVQSMSNDIFDKSKIQTQTLKMDYSTATNPQSMGAPGKSSSSTTLWIAERAVSASLVFSIPLAFAFPSKPLDILLAVTMVAHTYWGFEVIIMEYINTLTFGTLLPKILHVVLAVVMMLTLGGLFYIIFDDIGLAASIKRLWSIKSKKESH